MGIDLVAWFLSTIPISMALLMGSVSQQVVHDMAFFAIIHSFIMQEPVLYLSSFFMSLHCEVYYVLLILKSTEIVV